MTSDIQSRTSESSGILSRLRIGKWEAAILAVLLLLGLGIRLQRISNKLLDHHSFRQGTEAMMARNFARDGIVVQYPKKEGYAQWSDIEVNEFPLYPATVALAYKILGREHDAIGRLVTIMFSLATGFLCYLILRTHFQNSAPLWAMALFMLSPLGAYVGRCFLRHPMAFFFQALAFYLWLLWVKKPGWGLWIGVWISAAITGLMNFPNLYIGFPMGVALLVTRGWGSLKDKRIWWLVVATLLPPLLWLKHSLEFSSVFLASDPTGIKQRDLGRFIRLEWFNSDFFWNMWDGTWNLLLTPGIFILVVIGLCLGWRSKICWIIRAWLGIAFLYLCVDHYPIYLNRHEYYFVHLLTPACLLGGIAAGWIIGKVVLLKPDHIGLVGSAATIGLAMAILLPWQAYHFPLMEKYMVTEYGWSQHWAVAGAKVQELTEPEAVMVVDRPEDALIYYCDRPGWVNRFENIKKDQWQMSGGGDYLLVTSYRVGQDENGNWINVGFDFDNPPEGVPEEGLSPGSPAAPWVRANCPVIYDELRFQIIDLQPEKHGRSKPAPG
ncbi:MAG: glycosyltransferase family 39 protein [Candidatus Omnitrophica bacterium]|nr:glycosyltransferase family 39 protein [Candidatus Omnitrophota bacterium]